MTVVADTIVPMGSDAFETAPEIFTMSVSMPTPMVYRRYNAYWEFNPTRTGELSFDALLSHYMDPKMETATPYGPSVTLYLYEVSAVGNLIYRKNSSYWGGGQAGFPARNQGRFTYTVTAGKKYVLMTTGPTGFPWVATVVRIGDYPPPTVWQQPADITHVLSRGTDPRHPRTTNYPLGTNSGSTVSGVNTFHLSIGFRGEIEANQGFGGPHPSSEPDAVSCVWNWARRIYHGGDFWWTSTNQTEWTGGPGRCPTYSGEYVSEHTFTDAAIGYRYNYSAGSFMLPYEVDYTTYGISYICLPRNIETDATYTGTGSSAVYPAGVTVPTGSQIVWEGTKSKLISYELAPDEQAPATGNGAAITAKWYMGPTKTASEMAGAWGPRLDVTYGADIRIAGYSSWVGTPAGPESWVGSQTHIGDFNGQVTPWMAVPESLWDLPYGIRFVCLPHDLLSTTPPVTGGETDKTALRTGQFCAVRVTVRPSRYMIISPPPIPDITWEGATAIEMDQESVGQVLY